MKTIGLIGGMGWESSALYYRLINEETKPLQKLNICNTKAIGSGLGRFW